MRKKILSFFIGAVIVGVTWFPKELTVNAEEIEIPGYCEYTENEGESIVHWYGITRGTYLKEGICGIKDAGKFCDTSRASVCLDESSDGGQSFAQIGSYYFSENNTTSCHGSKAGISVRSGWCYMARGGHSATKGSTTESSTTRTGVLTAS